MATGCVSYTPLLQGYNSIYSTDSAEESEREHCRKNELGKRARKRFEAMLRALSGKRGEIARCMAFSLEHAEAAAEVSYRPYGPILWLNMAPGVRHYHRLTCRRWHSRSTQGGALASNLRHFAQFCRSATDGMEVPPRVPVSPGSRLRPLVYHIPFLPWTNYRRDI